MNRIKEYLLSKNIEIKDTTLDKFQVYYSNLIEWNNNINLTAITQYDDVIIKHFIDSLTAVDNINMGAKVMDIGAGAGFPSLPIKIVREDISLVMVDSLNKRVRFLNSMIDKLELKDTQALHSRAEDIARGGYRESQDYVLARAVASLSTLLEYSTPLLKIGGKFIAYKSSDYLEELEKAKDAQRLLGCKLVDIKEFCLIDNDHRRALIIYEKMSKTKDIYPRGKNMPKKYPL